MEGDYTTPCTGAEAVFLCQTAETRASSIVVSCLTVQNDNNNNTVAGPVLFPGSCILRPGATKFKAVLFVADAIALCGNGARFALTYIWPAGYPTFVTGFGAKYDVVLTRCECRRGVTGYRSEVSLEWTPLGHLPSCESVLTKTDWQTGELQDMGIIMSPVLGARECPAGLKLYMDILGKVGTCEPGSIRVIEPTAGDPSAAYSRISSRLCICPGARDIATAIGSTGATTDYTNIVHCTCFAVCDQTYTNDQSQACVAVRATAEPTSPTTTSPTTIRPTVAPSSPTTSSPTPAPSTTSPTAPPTMRPITPGPSYTWTRNTVDHVPMDGDYTSPCTGEEAVFLCQTTAFRLSVIITSCLTVHNRNYMNADPVLYPGSCTFSPQAYVYSQISGTSSAEPLCGVGATQVEALTWYPSQNVAPTGFEVKYDVVVVTCTCVRQDGGDAVLVRMAETPLGHIPSCESVLRRTDWQTGQLAGMGVSMDDTACYSAFNDPAITGGFCEPALYPQSIRAIEPHPNDTTASYSRIAKRLCVCPGARDIGGVDGTVHNFTDYSNIAYCTCFAVCEDGFIDSGTKGCIMSFLYTPCRLDELTYCPPNPMKATSCLMHLEQNNDLPYRVVEGSCGYSLEALTDSCGDAVVSGSVVRYSYDQATGTTESWLPGRRGALILADQDTLGPNLLFLPRCVCVDPSTGFDFEVWGDVQAQVGYDCNTWLTFDAQYPERYYSTDLISVTRLRQIGNSTETYTVDVMTPAILPAYFSTRLAEVSAFAYVGVLPGIYCPELLGVLLPIVTGMRPRCSWILDDAITLATLRSSQSIALCAAWGVDSPQWACSQSTRKPVPCGVGTTKITTICPTNSSDSEAIALSQLSCIKHCQCAADVITTESPCDSILSVCSSVEVKEHCSTVRDSGAPYSTCQMASLLVDGSKTFINGSCTGFVDEWTSGCGLAGVLDRDRVCATDWCDIAVDIYSWCGPNAASCQREGRGSVWKDVCTCKGGKRDSRVASLGTPDNTDLTYRRTRMASACATWPTIVLTKRRDFGTNNIGSQGVDTIIPFNANLRLANWFHVEVNHPAPDTNGEYQPRSVAELQVAGEDALHDAIEPFWRAATNKGGLEKSTPFTVHASITDACGFASPGYDLVLYRGTTASLPPDQPWHTRGVGQYPEPLYVGTNTAIYEDLVYMVRLRCLCTPPGRPYDHFYYWLSVDQRPDDWIQSDIRMWHLNQTQPSGPDPAQIQCQTGRSYYAPCPGISGGCLNRGICTPDNKCVCGTNYHGEACQLEKNTVPCPLGCDREWNLSWNGTCVCDGPWKVAPTERMSTCDGAITPGVDPCQNSVCTCDETNHTNPGCLGYCKCDPLWSFDSSCTKSLCYARNLPFIVSSDGCQGVGACTEAAECECDRDSNGMPLWSGDHCETAWCVGICRNGGICTLFGTDAPVCVCLEGTYGPKCESKYAPTGVSGDTCSDGGGTYDYRSSICTCANGRYGDVCAGSFSDPDVCGSSTTPSLWCSGQGTCGQSVLPATGLLQWQCMCTAPLFTGALCLTSICPLSVNGQPCHDLRDCRIGAVCSCSRRDWTATEATASDSLARLQELLAGRVRRGVSCDVDVLVGCADKPMYVPVSKSVRVQSLCGGDNMAIGECVVDEVDRTAQCVCAAGYVYTDFGNTSRCSSNTCSDECLHGTCVPGGPCVCNDDSVWSGTACDLDACPAGTEPSLAETQDNPSTSQWICLCIDRDFVAPLCIERSCPNVDGAECGKPWFHALEASGDRTLEFPFEYSSDVFSSTGVACNTDTGSCNCFDRIYQNPKDTNGVCVPWVDTDNTANITADRYNQPDSALTIVCKSVSTGQAWDPSTNCSTRICSNHGSVPMVNHPICDDMTLSCCCDEGFKGENCELTSVDRVCGQNTLISGTGCRCKYPWEEDPLVLATPNRLDCTQLRCSTVGTNADTPVVNNRCKCIDSYTGVLCTVYTAPNTLRPTLIPTTKAPTVTASLPTPSPILVTNPGVTAQPTRLMSTEVPTRSPIGTRSTVNGTTVNGTTVNGTTVNGTTNNTHACTKSTPCVDTRSGQSTGIVLAQILVPIAVFIGGILGFTRCCASSGDASLNRLSADPDMEMM
jgi:hypothetical protein